VPAVLEFAPSPRPVRCVLEFAPSNSETHVESRQPPRVDPVSFGMLPERKTSRFRTMIVGIHTAQSPGREQSEVHGIKRVSFGAASADSAAPLIQQDYYWQEDAVTPPIHVPALVPDENPSVTEPGSLVAPLRAKQATSVVRIVRVSASTEDEAPEWALGRPLAIGRSLPAGRRLSSILGLPSVPSPGVHFGMPNRPGGQ
jgi:hypothetical protein